MFPTPNTSANRIKLTRSGYLKAGLAALFVVGSIIMYVFQLDHFDKILDVRYFLLLSLLLGIALGMLLGKKFAANEYELYEQMRIYVICIVMSIFFMPLFVSLGNKYLDFRTPESKQAQIVAFRTSAAQPFGHLKGEDVAITRYEFALLLEERIYKFNTKRLPFPNNKMGDIIQVPVHQGLVGISYLQF